MAVWLPTSNHHAHSAIKFKLVCRHTCNIADVLEVEMIPIACAQSVAINSTQSVHLWLPVTSGGCHCLVARQQRVARCHRHKRQDTHKRHDKSDPAAFT